MSDKTSEDGGVCLEFVRPTEEVRVGFNPCIFMGVALKMEGISVRINVSVSK